MNWILDRIALVLTSIACALGAWAFYRYTGRWSGPIIMTIVTSRKHQGHKRPRYGNLT